MAATATMFAGAAAGAGISVVADTLIVRLKRATGCKRQCKNLQKMIEMIKPYLDQVERQLHEYNNEAQQRGEIITMARWLADMRAQMLAADREVYSCLSGHEVISNLNLIENNRIGKRIEEVNFEISVLIGAAATVAQFSFNLANTPPVAGTVQQHNANAQIHHGYSSTPNVVQTANFQRQDALYHRHSLPAMRTPLYPPITDQTMSQHSSPVSAHDTPSSWPWSNQSQAAASWTPPGTLHRLHHSRSEPEPFRGCIMSPDQWDAPRTPHHHHSQSEPEPFRRLTMSPDQWQAASYPPQHVPSTSYEPSAPPQHSAPPSVPPVRNNAAPPVPYSFSHAYCAE